MKFLLPSLAFLVAVNAQYFSAGWKPGQPAHTEAVKAPPKTADSGAPVKDDKLKERISPSSLLKMMDINYLLTTKPMVKLFSKAGMNISHRLAELEAVPWDTRIPLITDDNYFDLVVNETLSAEEEKDRVWAMVITAANSKEGTISRFSDDAFDEAYNLTLIAGDLPHVKWGRIDYLNVTYLTTKWGVWQAPYFVIAKDRGRTLRFLQAHRLRLRDGAFRVFLQQDGWKEVPVWDTSFSPGGSREWYLHYLGTAMAQIYNVTVQVPRWILYLVSGTIASFLIGVMHRSGQAAAPTPKPKPALAARPVPAAEAAPAPEAVASGSNTGAKKGGKQRKSKK